ncbi:enoyl-CoA hydratase-related protein [Kordiimonas gwangyangensis]|uniref:enoyl-CoA hydratase-related protein n=1 Tax=Kordiimonas gwangyangensis TaxID=288022 RepID=UPI00036A4199|nr:enoyl-CoA hydratase-related protein [Kordiimonas gwangyangensis]
MSDINASILRQDIGDGTVVLQLNRPAQRNALSLALRRELAAHCQVLDADRNCKVVVITGDHAAFAAGADLAEFAHTDGAGLRALDFAALWRPVAALQKPLIAAVEGYALGGGCELALHADIIIAAENAILGFPEVKLGILPGAGGTQRLVRAIGKYRALKLLMTGDFITGHEAVELGLVTEAVPPNQVLMRALELAAELCKRPPLALCAIKEVVLNAADLPLEEALEIEREKLFFLFDTQDKVEGISAFFEKRTAEFKGQ